MSDVSKETGILAVLAKRMVDQRLPKALELKEKVDRGEVLADADIAFLEEVLADARKIPQGIKDNPKFKDIGGRMMQLYNEITAKALENESNRK
jgi:hypothetical protein